MSSFKSNIKAIYIKEKLLYIKDSSYSKIYFIKDNNYANNISLKSYTYKER